MSLSGNSLADSAPFPPDTFWENVYQHSSHTYKEIQPDNSKWTKQQLRDAFDNVGSKVVRHWNEYDKSGYEFQKGLHSVTSAGFSLIPAGEIVNEFIFDPANDAILRGYRKDLGQLFAGYMYELEKSGALASFAQLPFEEQRSLLENGSSHVSRLMRGNEYIRTMVETYLQGSFLSELEKHNQRTKAQKKKIESSQGQWSSVLEQRAKIGKNSANLSKALSSLGAAIQAQEVAPSTILEDAEAIKSWQAVSDYSKGIDIASKALLEFGASTGMSPEQIQLLSDVNNASKLVSGIASVVIAPTPEKVLSLLPAFGKIFGGGGKKKRDRLLALMKLQQETLKRLHRIEQKIDRYHIEQMAKLLDIESSLIVSGGVIDSLALGDALHCHRVLQRNDAKSFQRHAAKIERSVFQERCLAGLALMFNASQDVYPGLWLTPAKINFGRSSSSGTGGANSEFSLGSEGGVNGFLREYHVPLWNQVVSKLSPVFRKSLYSNYFNLRDLNWVENFSNSQDYGFTNINDEKVGQLRNLIDPVQARIYSKLARKAYGASSLFRQFGRYGGKFDIGSTTLDFVNQEQDIGLSALLSAYDTISTAHAQQTYYSGGSILPLIVELLEPPWQSNDLGWLQEKSLVTRLYDPTNLQHLSEQYQLKKSNDKETRQSADHSIKAFKQNTAASIMNSLNRNPLLRRNVGRYYAFKKTTQSYGSSFSIPYQYAYSAACRKGLFSGMQRLLGQKFSFELINLDRQQLAGNESSDVPCLAFKATSLDSDKTALIELPTPKDMYNLQVSATAYSSPLDTEKIELAKEIAFLRSVYEAISEDIPALGLALATYGIHYH